MARCTCTEAAHSSQILQWKAGWKRLGEVKAGRGPCEGALGAGVPGSSRPTTAARGRVTSVMCWDYSGNRLGWIGKVNDWTGKSCWETHPWSYCAASGGYGSVSWDGAKNRYLYGISHVMTTVLYFIRTDPLALGDGGVYCSGSAETQLPCCCVSSAGQPGQQGEPSLCSPWELQIGLVFSITVFKQP